MQSIRVVPSTLAMRPDLSEGADRLTSAGWPTFMKKDPVSLKYWGDLSSFFGGFQTALLREDNSAIIAVANSIPLRYEGAIEELPDEGWDWALETGCEQRKKGIEPNILCALQIFIDPAYRGTGLSSIMLSLMKSPGRYAGFRQLIAPVRPPLKSLYPRAPMEEFITWTGRDGLSLDPWIRTHQKCGAQIIKVCSKSFVVDAPVQEWEEWTTRSFAGQSEVCIPEGLTPVRVDSGAKRAVYAEPNVWMLHPIEPDPAA